MEIALFYFSDRFKLLNCLLIFNKNEIIYLVLMDGRIRQQIHIPEYLAEVCCRFPKSEAHILSTSEHVIEQFLAFDHATRQKTNIRL